MLNKQKACERLKVRGKKERERGRRREGEEKDERAKEEDSQSHCHLQATVSTSLDNMRRKAAQDLRGVSGNSATYSLDRDP